MRPIKLLLAVAPALLCIAACGSGDSGPAAPLSADVASTSAAAEPETGTLSLALQLAGGSQINTVSYVVLGPNFTKSGTLDVSNSSTVSGVIGGIPIASGYTLTLNASSTATPPTQCDGSAAFNITSASITTVPVHVTCHQPNVIITPPVAAPIPPLAILALGTILLGIGGAFLRREKTPAA